ncbi:MAG: hypothetical protein JNK74_08040 [Candidatus Hydrogenedentes bacterium]|nr:hypothetical protein [Candidatus Hydrogenedentota bacterium]
MDYTEFDEDYENWDKPSMPTITAETVRELHQDKSTKRICFAPYYEHCNYLKVKPAGNVFVGAVNFPFAQGVKWVFPRRLFRNRNSDKPLDVWYGIKTQEEFELIQDWIHRQGERVYLRDGLSISIALALNFRGLGEQYTEIGALQNAAKYREDRMATERLVEACCKTIVDLPYLNCTKYIAAVPSEVGKPFHLPYQIAGGVAHRLHLNDISHSFSEFAKQKLKDRGIEQKWDDWEATGLMVNRDLSGQDVILVDDLYQSGTTLQFVAMKLQKAGARNVFGLCLVKSLGNTDNKS